jgi:enamine deaminase RidA (YjgF/YER057c/UK114 family)
VKTAGNYLPIVRTGNLIFVSGHTGGKTGERITGKVGAEQTLEGGYAAARGVADDVLATLERELGSLDRIVRIVKVLGMVNVDPSFTHMPAVINGASDRFIEVLGERGRHARSAIGVASLPANASVEIELIAEIRD